MVEISAYRRTLVGRCYERNFDGLSLSLLSKTYQIFKNLMSLIISDVELFPLHHFGLQHHGCNGCPRRRLLPIHWTKMVQICKILLPTTRLLFPLCWRKWKISSSKNAWHCRGKEVKSFPMQMRISNSETTIFFPISSFFFLQGRIFQLRSN